MQPFSHFLRKQDAFTFVELLVVITIIGVLMAIGLANYQTINKKGRDGKRKSDLEQIRAALEIYRSDQGTYPVAAASPSNGELATQPCGGTLKSSDGSISYMDPIPCDPKSPSQDYVYDRLTETTYTLEATMEVDTDTGSCGSGSTYCVKQP